MFRRRKAAEGSDSVDASVVDEVTDVSDDDAALDDGTTAATPFERVDGPFDESEAESSDDPMLDLGSLRVPAVPGLKVRVEVNEATSVVMAITAMLGDSELQLTAFAAPRSGGLWDEIREEIAAAVSAAGGTAEVVDGPFGQELRARRPAKGPGGRTVFAPGRFLGVDGPRWFLRGVLGGRAAIDDAAAAPLLDIYRGTVVVRGSDPMGPREMLPIVLPPEPSPTQSPEVDEDGDGAPAAPTLDPFERGPEITQVG